MKKPRIFAPHDATFRKYLAHPKVARDFMELHLPPNLRALCDLTTLKLESGSFIEDDLRPYYSDILYSLRTSKGAGYIYVTIEHQSRAEKHIAFRMMRYSIAAMQRHLDAGSKKLPLVMPILFYTGKPSPHPHSMNWLQGFAVPDLARQLYSSDFPLVDITVIPDNEILRHKSMATLTLLQKHIRQRDLTELVRPLAITIASSQINGQLFKTVVEYMLTSRLIKDSRLFIQQLAQQLADIEEGPMKKQMLTLAEQLEMNGIEIGIEKGREEGMEKGSKAKALKIAGAMLTRGIPPMMVMELTELSESEISQISY
ncbi:MAG: Rpn family recombination-promoting nuclease/putative transposase [Enterobacteriaceae bacterium]